MTPTDAQIEAEARVRVWDALTDQGKLAWRLDAKAALTAAAEVENKNAPACPTCGASEPDWNAAAAFDAQAATIERCAKFAENYFEMEYEKGYGEMIADAMREALLKDKP